MVRESDAGRRRNAVLLEEIRSDVRTVAEGHSTLVSGQEELRAGQEALRKGQEELGAAIGTLHSRVDSLDSRVGVLGRAIIDGFHDVRSSIVSLTSRFEAHERAHAG